MAKNVFFAAADIIITGVSIGEKENEVPDKKEHRQSLRFGEIKANRPEKNSS
jgi:hypothetical protein